MLDKTKEYKIKVFKKSMGHGLRILQRFCYFAQLPLIQEDTNSQDYIKYDNTIILFENNKILCKTTSAYKMMRFLIWGSKK